MGVHIILANQLDIILLHVWVLMFSSFSAVLQMMDQATQNG